MGIKKLSKKLVKLGRKASEGAGKNGKRWVEAVFETAIGVIEERVQKRGAKPGKPSKPSPGGGSVRTAASRPRKAAQPGRTASRPRKAAQPRKPVAKLPAKRARPPRVLRPAGDDQLRAAHADVAPAAQEPRAHVTGSDDRDKSAT